MEKLVIKYDTQEATPMPLTKAMATDIFNLVLEGKTGTEIKYSLRVKYKTIKAFYSRLLIIRNVMITIVNSKSAPTTLAGLKLSTSAEISAQHNLTDWLFNAQDEAETTSAIEYVVSKIVAHSNTANNATFAWWKSKVIV